MRIYRREAVGHAWLVNPITQTLDVYRLESGRWVLLDTYEGEVVVRAEPFDAIELSLAVLWAQSPEARRRAAHPRGAVVPGGRARAYLTAAASPTK